jgi:hypothetical protein
MKKYSCLCIAMICTFQLAFAQKEKIIFADNFNDNHNKWVSYISKNISYLVYNGKYVMDTNDSLIYNVGVPVNIDTAKNYSITITATHTSGVDDAGYGIYFGASDVNNYYIFYISDNGYYRLSKNTSAAYTELIKWTTSSAMKTGNYVDNIIQIAKEGGNWKLMINGQLVNTVSTTPLMGNLVGFSKADPQRIEFDDLKVTQY